MKINRQKKVQRILTFYRNHFGFRKPYQILVDGTFCAAALRFKIDIAKQLSVYLGEEIKLFTTVCVVNEVEKFGQALYGPMLVVKQFPIRKCDHERNPISASKCLHSLVDEGNSNHLMVATQDSQLSQNIRSQPGIPLIYISHNAIIMEKESKVSQEVSRERFAINATTTIDSQTETIRELLKQKGLAPDPIPMTKKRRGPKGPNPLSCKKRKVKSKTNQSTDP